METEHIVITDKGLVTFKDESGEHSAPLSRVLDPKVSDMLPFGCRVCVRDQTKHLFVIEQAPCLRDVNWKPDPKEWKSLLARGGKRTFGQVGGNNTRTSFRLAFPFTIFLVLVDGVCANLVRVFFRQKGIGDPRDGLFVAGLIPDDTFLIEDQTPLRHHGMNSASVAEAAVEFFWRQTFGTWRPFGQTHPDVPQVASVWEWEHASRKTEWIFRADWTRHDQTLSSAIKSVQMIGSINETGVDSVFAAVVRRVKDHTTTIVADEGFVESPQASIRIGNTLVRQGDELDIELIRRTVEGFYEPRQGHKGVYAKLEGVADPVCIGDSRGLIDYILVKPKKPEPKTEAVLDGNLWKAGVKFHITSTEEYPSLLLGAEYRIAALEVDEDGDVRVRVGDAKEWLYISVGNGKLNTSVKLLVPELRDNKFTYGTAEISVGDMIVFQKELRRVSDLQKKGDVFSVTFEGEETSYELYSDGSLRIAWATIPYKQTSKLVVLGDNSIDLSQMDHFVVIKDSTKLRYGSLYKALKFVRSKRDGSHLFDVDLLVQYGNEPVPIIRQSQWVFPGDEYLCWVNTAYDNGNLHLNKGDVLVVERDFDLFHKGEEVTILCFKNTDIVFEDGRTIQLSTDIFETMSRKDGTGFDKKELKGLPQTRSVRQKIGIGDRCKVVGNNFGGDHIGFVGKVTERGSSQLFLEFDNTQSNNTQRCCTGKWYYDSDLEYIGERIATSRLFFANIGRCVGKRANGSSVEISPEMMTERARLAQIEFSYKMRQEKDMRGNKISRGDIVVPTESIFSVECPKEVLGKPMLVVNSALGAEQYLFLLPCDESLADKIAAYIGQGAGLPDVYIKRISEFHANPPRGCERLQIIESEPEPEVVTYKKGTKVKLALSGTPTYLVGNVTTRNVGVVTKTINDKLVVVDFPNHKGWFGYPRDLIAA